MGVIMSVKGRHFFFFFSLLHVIVSFEPLSTNAYTMYFETVQLNAMQSLREAWIGTPSDHLAGWNATQPYPCTQGFTDEAPNWRGFQCVAFNFIKNASDIVASCNATIFGLILNDVLIVGELPPAIGDIYTLSILELTGNPNLTGPLPSTLGNAYLYTLDLHDNGLYGEIANLQNLILPLKLDLSGNQFTGSSPISLIKEMKSLQTLNLARNKFTGAIPDIAFENMTQLNHLDLSNNGFSGPLPKLSMLQNLESLDMSGNKFQGSLPDLTNLTYPLLRTVNLSWNQFAVPINSVCSSPLPDTLSTLDLSGNNMTGDLTSLWMASGLVHLEELYLDSNSLSGTLDLTALSAQGVIGGKSPSNSSQVLNMLSLRNNSITAVSYDGINIEHISTVIRLQGNPFCETSDTDDGSRCFCLQICLNAQSAMKANNRKVVIIASVTSAVGLLVLGMIGFAVVLHSKRKYKEYFELEAHKKFEECDVKPTIFPYKELCIATRDFHSDMKLGEGGYGVVYKGILPNENAVAVKKLLAKTTQATDDFLNEVVLITGMKHRNLVHLKGCCIRGNQRLLVYEYADNFDVDQILLGSNKTSVSWPIRLKICLGVAHGLHYLHALARPRIIHRDIKASNILLDKNYEPKIADFGLALLFPDEQSHMITIHIAGTKGYVAPEYASLGQLSDKVDVFSFGVLCLEIVSGRRNIDHNQHPDQVYLSKWAWDLQGQGKLMDLVDPTLSLHDDEKLEVQRVINIALLCVQSAAAQRPTMGRVAAMLQGESESEVGEVMPPGKDEQYLDTIRLLAFGKSGLFTVQEEGESSIRRGSAVSGGGNSSAYPVLEMSELRAR